MLYWNWTIYGVLLAQLLQTSHAIDQIHGSLTPHQKAAEDKDQKL